MAKHIHKYYKARDTITSSEFLWTCAAPNCSHHMPKHYEKTLRGKATECWGYGRNEACEKYTILDEERTLLMDKPLCQACDPKYIPVRKIIEELEPENEPITNLDAIQERMRQEAFEAAAAISKKDGE